MLDWIVCIKYQYLKLFNCVQIELLELDGSKWNHLIVY